MKKSKIIHTALLLTVALLSSFGCHKSADTPAVPEINGVKVDFPKLQRTFDGSSSEIQQKVSDAVAGVRYGMYEKSLEALDSLATDPNVTEPQKKVVNELIESLKQLA